MQSTDKEFRYEIKIPLENTPVFQINRWVNLHPMLFRKTFPSRQVNNIYFDTQNNDTLQDHMDGIYHRQKLRLRWYGSGFVFNNSRFEIKSKLGNLGKKDFHAIENEVDLANQPYADMIKSFQPGLPPILTELLAVSHPVLINHYQRDYFETADRSIRLTIDYQHHTFDQRFSKMPNISFSEPFHDIPIIEIKSSMKNYNQVAKAISYFPLRPNQFSKYLDGMLSILNR